MRGGSVVSQCLGKEAFERREHAQKAADRIRRRDGRINIYRCHYCRKWHVGNRMEEV